MLSNKLKFHGIQLIEQEESYTSKCSSFDLESIEKHEVYMGKRIRRGKFRTSDKMILNADLNGALNILRKSLEPVFDCYLFNNLDKLKRYLCSPIRIFKGEVLAKDCNFNSCSDQLWTFSKSLNAVSS